MSKISQPPELNDPNFNRWLFLFWKSVTNVVAVPPAGQVLNTVPYGGTGVQTVTGYLKGNGTSPFTGVSQIPWSDISGKPTSLSYGPNITALDLTATAGIYAVTAYGTSAVRTMTGTASRISVTNGDGVSGNPTFNIDTGYVGQTSITTLGTIATGTWNAGAVTSSSTITGTAGTGSGAPVMIGTLSVNTTAVGNVGTGVDNLMSYTLPANSLSAEGKGVRITAWFKAANNANLKAINFRFGGISDGVFASQNNYSKAVAEVFATGVNTQTYLFTYYDSGVAPAIIGYTATETSTAAIIIKFTGEATSDDDIVQNGMLVEFIS